MKKRVLSVLLAASMAVVAFAGCGSSGTTSGSASAAASGSASASASTSAAATGEAEYAMISGTTTPDVHPYNLGLVKMGELLS